MGSDSFHSLFLFFLFFLLLYVSDVVFTSFPKARNAAEVTQKRSKENQFTIDMWESIGLKDIDKPAHYQC